ncbi:hypothetical protein [Pseudomonas phage vB_Pae_CF79a]|nr:hypothetical protein [Pseudomonas phage vB_Pae_CF79a]
MIRSISLEQKKFLSGENRLSENISSIRSKWTSGSCTSA